MARCHHVYQSNGRTYDRRDLLFGGELFTVVSHDECIHCSKQERRVVLKKRVDANPEAFERQLRFTGIKPAQEHRTHAN